MARNARVDFKPYGTWYCRSSLGYRDATAEDYFVTNDEGWSTGEFDGVKVTALYADTAD